MQFSLDFLPAAELAGGPAAFAGEKPVEVKFIGKTDCRRHCLQRHLRRAQQVAGARQAFFQQQGMKRLAEVILHQMAGVTPREVHPAGQFGQSDRFMCVILQKTADAVGVSDRNAGDRLWKYGSFTCIYRGERGYLLQE